MPFVISWGMADVGRIYQGDSRLLYVEAGFPTVQFGGPYSEVLHDRIAPALQRAPLTVAVSASADGQLFFEAVILSSIEGPPAELVLAPTPGFPGVLDEEGFPTARPLDFQTDFSLSVHGNPPGHIQGEATVNASLY